MLIFPALHVDAIDVYKWTTVYVGIETETTKR